MLGFSSRRHPLLKRVCGFLKDIWTDTRLRAALLNGSFDIDGDLFERQYKHHLSGYWQWKDSTEGLHAERWRVFPQNIGPRLSIDRNLVKPRRALYHRHQQGRPRQEKRHRGK